MRLTSFLVPLVIAGVLCFGLAKGKDVFDQFLAGAKEGLATAAGILPALVALMTCVGMFKASGGLDVLVNALTPAARAVGAPGELLPLVLLRPISGSGALVLFEDLLKSCGPDSMPGRAASILMGSTETTFYTIAVYFGAVRIRRTRHTLACSLAADLTGFAMSLLLARALF